MYLLQTCRYLTDRLVFLIGNNYIAACLVPVTMTCNHVLTVVTYGTCLCANTHLENAMRFWLCIATYADVMPDAAYNERTGAGPVITLSNRVHFTRSGWGTEVVFDVLVHKILVRHFS